MKRKLLSFVIISILFFPALSMAQWSVGPHIVVSIPTADFANVSGTGGGFGIKVIRNVGALGGGLGLRGDFAFLTHGKDFEAVQSSFGTFLAEIRNESFRLTFGPQYAFGGRNVKFHAVAEAGFYIFRTNVNLPTNFGFFQDTRDSDAAVGWNFGGGIQYDIGLGPWLDLSVEYQTIYNITSPTTRENENGEIETIKRDITANEITLKIGIIFFLK